MKNKLIKFILSFTDYDKIKKENEELKKDIYILIEKPDTTDAFLIIHEFKTKKQLYNLFWFGSANIISPEAFINTIFL